VTASIAAGGAKASRRHALRQIMPGYPLNTGRSHAPPDPRGPRRPLHLLRRAPHAMGRLGPQSPRPPSLRAASPLPGRAHTLLLAGNPLTPGFVALTSKAHTFSRCPSLLAGFIALPGRAHTPPCPFHRVALPANSLHRRVGHTHARAAPDPVLPCRSASCTIASLHPPRPACIALQFAQIALLCHAICAMVHCTIPCNGALHHSMQSPLLPSVSQKQIPTPPANLTPPSPRRWPAKAAKWARPFATANRSGPFSLRPPRFRGAGFYLPPLGRQ
jgi:hypothetical protein